MNWWTRLLRSGPELGAESNRALDAYRALPAPDLRCSPQATRCIVADALATAQLFQIVLAQAAQQGMESCADLVKLGKGRRWLGVR